MPIVPTTSGNVYSQPQGGSNKAQKAKEYAKFTAASAASALAINGAWDLANCAYIRLGKNNGVNTMKDAAKALVSSYGGAKRFAGVTALFVGFWTGVDLVMKAVRDKKANKV